MMITARLVQAFLVDHCTLRVVDWDWLVSEFERNT